MARPGTRAYAGLITRAVALAIDVVIMNAVGLTVTVVIGLVLSVIVPGKNDIDLPTALAAALGWLVFVGGYLVVFWALIGRTPGMRLMRVEVVSATGENIGVARALRRLGGMVLAAIPLGAGFLLTLVDDRRQGLHDKLAGTVVVYTAERTVQGANLDGHPAALPAPQAVVSRVGLRETADGDHSALTAN